MDKSISIAILNSPKFKTVKDSLEEVFLGSNLTENQKQTIISAVGMAVTLGSLRAADEIIKNYNFHNSETESF